MKPIFTNKFLIIFSILLLISQTPLFAQFNDININIAGANISEGSIAWGDYDNDGDLDLLICGDLSPSGRTTTILRNRNDGTFEDSGVTGLTDISSGVCKWGDYDNDGDLDILLVGGSGSGNIAKIFRNEGSNNFSDINSTAISAAASSFARADWGDYDNDGDLDIIITGQGTTAQIFRNDAGSFVNSGISLEDVQGGAAQWGDYDNDGDLDLLLAGKSSGGAKVKIYRNKGDGTFEDSGINNLATVDSDAAWGDYDNDGDLDLIVSGQDDNNNRFLKIYENKGNNTFTDINSPNLIGVSDSSIKWGDYDNDGDLDVIVMGTEGNMTSSQDKTRIYQNQGNNTFVDAGINGLPGYMRGVIALGDYDNDDDLDLAFAGGNNTKVFRNFSNVPNTRPGIPGNLQATVSGTSVTFTWTIPADQQTGSSGLQYNILIGSSVSGVEKRSPEAFTDASSNLFGTRKVIRRGAIQKNTWTIKNLAAGTYYWNVQSIDAGFKGSFFATSNSFEVQTLPDAPTSLTVSNPSANQGQIKLTWFAGTSVNEIGFEIQRSTSSGTGFVVIDTVDKNTTTYIEDNTLINNGTTYYYKVRAFNTRGASAFTSEQSATSSFQSFSLKSRTVLPDIRSGSVAWGDYDNDGDLDLLVSGRRESLFQTFTRIYRNLGNGNFTDSGINNLPNLAFSAVAWGDYDGDGDLDIILTGSMSESVPNPTTKIFRNNGDGTFTDSGINNLVKISSGSVDWGDYDNDGDLDLVIAGITEGDAIITRIYQNNGAGAFTDSITTLPKVAEGAVIWGDYDNDGDLDLLLTGTQVVNNPTQFTKIYRNDGNNNFTDSGINLPQLSSSNADWGDYDNDGDLDLAIIGSNGSNGVAKIYRNKGDGTFEDSGINSLTQVELGSVQWGDYDNDGDLDLLITGSSGIGGAAADIFRNDGSNTFANSGISVLQAVATSAVVWGDYDEDGDLDIILTGLNESNSSAYTYIYRNDVTNTNTKPTTPANLQAVVTNDTVTLTWDKATDTQTSQNSLTYNLRIGTSSNQNNLRPSMAITGTGFRTIVKQGKLGNSQTLRGLAPNIYYWSVQALDNSYKGSSFATEGTFRIVIAPVVPTDLNAKSQSSSTILLSWTKIATAANFSSYIIERSDGNNTNFQPIDTITSDVNQYESQNLNENTTYFYRIRAVNTAGSALSSEASNTTNNLPRAPINVQATTSSVSQVNLTWTDVAITEQGFIIFRKSLLSNNEFQAIDTINTQNTESYSDTKGVVGNIKYTYAIRTFNTNGQSINSVEASATTPIDNATSLPPKPLNFFANPFSPSQISLEWTYTSTSANSFVIERSPQSDSANYQQIAEIPAQTLRAYSDTTGLTENNIYYYRMRARNSGGLSDFSDIALAKAECNLPIFVSLAEGQVNQVCIGQGAKIEVTADLFQPTYQWLRNGVKIPSANAQFYVAYQTGEYTCEVSSGVCTQTTKSAVVVVVKDPLTVNITSQDGVLVPSITNAETYTWYYNFEPIAGANGVNFTPTTNGKYYVVIQKDGCNATSNVVDLTSVVGLDENDLSRAITLSPNPASNEVEMSIKSNLQGKYQLWLINAQGQRFSLGNGTKSGAVLKKRLSLKQYPARVYHVLIQLGDKRGTKKLIKY